MFERFTDDGRLVLVGATDVAKERNSPYIRRHHMLIALIDGADGSELVADVLDAANVDRSELRVKLLESLTASEEPDLESGSKPFSGGGKKALELSLREALSLGHNYIDSFHLLLAILRSADGPLAAVVEAAGLNYDTARALVRTRAPEGRRRGGGRRGRFGRGMGRGGSSRGVDRVLTRAFTRASSEREVTTGDLLVALAETPDTHFATIVKSALPELSVLTAEADRLIRESVVDGGPDNAIRFDEASGSVTINDPTVAEEFRRVWESSGGAEKVKEALRRLRAEDDK